jgi:hypothetical protein
LRHSKRSSLYIALIAVLASFVTASPPTFAASGGSALAVNEALSGSSSQYLKSPNLEYQLIMQGDGNLVLYGPGQTPLWYTRTNGGSDRRLVMQGDGNLVIYDGANRALWNTQTGGNAGAVLNLQDDGNLVLYAPGGRPIWYTGTSATGLVNGASLSGATSQYIQSPNRQYRLVMQGDGNLVVYRGSEAQWATWTNGGSDRRLVMQSDGNLVIYDATNRALWNTQTGGNAGAVLNLQDDGNVVLYSPGGRAIWSRVTGAIGSPGASLVLPFPAGQTWRVCQGYNNTGGTHASGSQRYALDIVKTSACWGPANGSTGQQVSSPVTGVVSYRDPYDNGDFVCINYIRPDGTAGSLGVAHFYNSVSVGQHVSAGQVLGTIKPGGANARIGAVAHVHVQVHVGSGCGNASVVPFDSAHGTAFVGAPDMPSNGSANQWANTPVSRP